MSDEFDLEDYRTLVHAIDVGVVLQHASGEIVAANPAASRLLGLTHEQLIGRDSMDPRWEARRENGETLPGEEHPAMVTLRTGVVSENVIMQVALPHGERVWLSVTARPLFREKSDVPSHVAVSFRDVTSAVRRDREAEQHRLAFEHVGIGAVIISFRDRGKILSCNRAYADMLGRSDDELVGLNVDDLMHPADADIVVAALGDLVAGTTHTASLEVRSLRGDGSWVWTLSYATLLRDDDGAPLYGIAQTIDITDRKLADEKLNTYVAQISDVVVVVDSHGVVGYVSPGIEKALGYAVADVTGANALDFVLEDDQALAMQSLSNTVRRPGPAPPLLVRMRTANGEVRPVELVANNKLNDPAIRGVIITARDVSDRLDLETRLRDRDIEFERLEARRAREQLELELARAQRLESLGRLSGGIAHDFNNLLGVILNYSTLLHRRSDLDERVRADIDSMRRAAERGTDLVRQLLQFARREPPTVERFDVGAVARSVVRLLDRALGSHIQLQLEVRGHASVDADRGQVEQVLVNLVLNARDAVSGDGVIQIVVDAAETDFSASVERGLAGPVVLVRVRDNGVGMDESVLRTAFEPFFTTKPPGEGSGLGLSSVHGIVAALGGVVWIESTPGVGTTVTCALPLAAEELTPERTGTVLLIDDEADVGEMTAAMLRSVGWQVVIATTASAALARLDGDPPVDLVLCDARMPELDGISPATVIRERSPDIPIVLMSSRDVDLDELRAAVIADVIVKPFAADELLRVLRATLPN